MGLETATYLSDLVPTNPPSSDLRSQGDDHLRLTKSVLQNTFPTATKPFYFPSIAGIVDGGTIAKASQNGVVQADTTSSNVGIVLPTLASGDTGWYCDVVKIFTDVNAIVVTPASGTILSSVGSTSTIRVGIPCSPARFWWSGTQWYCYKAGPPIGSTMGFDGGTVPPGYLEQDGSAYSNVAFAELFAILASSNIKDKRGRVEIASGSGSGLTTRALGTNYGAETAALSTTNLPAQTPAGTVASSFASTDVVVALGQIPTGVAGGSSFSMYASGTYKTSSGTVTSSFTGTPFAGQNATAFAILNPSIGTKRIIKAC